MKIEFSVRHEEALHTLAATAYVEGEELADYGIDPTMERQAIGEVLFRLGPHQKDTPHVRERMEKLLVTSLLNSVFEDSEAIRSEAARLLGKIKSEAKVRKAKENIKKARKPKLTPEKMEISRQRRREYVKNWKAQKRKANCK